LFSFVVGAAGALKAGTAARTANGAESVGQAPTSRLILKRRGRGDEMATGNKRGQGGHTTTGHDTAEEEGTRIDKVQGARAGPDP